MRSPAGQQALETPNAANPVGLLLMAYGSPASLDDIPAYLADIRGGRETPASLIDEIRDRYAQIGVRSPLVEWTYAQAAALERALNEQGWEVGRTYRAYVGMRHWVPKIQDAVTQMVADGITRGVALVMAPHRSRLSTGAYFANLDQALETVGSSVEFKWLQDWHTYSGFIASLVEKVREGIANFAPHKPYVLFTAHSLPASILVQGDPYDAQILETSTLLADALNLPDGRWRMCYQSAGQSNEMWLGPSIEQAIDELANAGEKAVLAVPVGFVCDHIEILYDLDIAARVYAASKGIQFARSESLNTSPSFIQALAKLVIQ